MKRAVNHPSLSPARALLIVDDTKLRRQAAGAAEKLVRRLDRLAQAAESFYGLDQRLFQDWYNLTFRAELARLDSLTNEYAKLSRQKEAVLAYAAFARVSPDEAYAFLEEEKLRFELGSPEEKSRIEEARRYRQRQAATGQKEARAEAREKRKAKAEASAMKDWWAWFSSLSSPDIRTLAEQEPEYSAEALLAGLLTAEEDWQRDAGLRFWDETSAYVRKLASRRYLEHRGEELEDFVRARRGGSQQKQRASASPEASSRLRPEEENLKLLYRKFVRYLHPDARGPGANLESWQKKMWHDGQEAYQSGNYPALHALYRVMMLRLGKLGELTMGEIQAIASGIEREFRELQRQTKEMRKAPFWKFSKRKDYFDLTRRFRASFDVNLKGVEEELNALRAEFRSWALIAEGMRGRAARAEKRGGKKRHRR